MKPTANILFAIFFALPICLHAQLWPVETLKSDLIGAWTRSADFDNDNDPDILVQSGDTIYWYENLRPGWTPHIIDVTFYNSIFAYVDVVDIDSDGDMDVLKAPASSTGTDSLTWNENTSNGTTWVKHTLIKTDSWINWLPLSFGDLDADNDLDLVIAETDYGALPGVGSLYWLENEGNTGVWTKHALRSGNHWYSSVADMDGDGDLDIVGSQEGVFWLENQLPSTSWATHIIAHEGGGFTHFLGACSDLNGDGKPDIASIAPTDSTVEMVQYLNPNWEITTINNTASGLLYVGQSGDIDGDGDNDIPYGGVGGFEQALGWAENQNNGANWVLHDITEPSTKQMIPTGLGDIDGDGDTDIISLTFDGATGLGSAIWAANPKISVGVSTPQTSETLTAISIWPNPFSASTTIQYELANTDDLTLSFYNLLGQKIRTLSYTRQDAGTHVINWDGKQDNGAPAPNGMYFIQFETQKENISRTVVKE